jgi:hypothetical protein
MGDIKLEITRTIKRFYCRSRDLCIFKNQFVNQRCFADYKIRATCRYLARNERDIERLKNE